MQNTRSLEPFQILDKEKIISKAAALTKLSDTLTLSPPRGADYAHILTLLGKKMSMIMPLISPIIWLINTHSFHHRNGPKAPFAKKNTNCHIPILKFFIISILKFSNDTITNKKEQMPPQLISLLMCRFESRLQPIKIKVFLLLELCPSNRSHQCTFIFTNFLVRMLQYL